jgi:uncharacterized damage-inducible protein DinB
MTDLAFNVGLNFSRYYQQVADELHRLVDPLSEEQIWSKPFAYGNSIGHLLLHVTGNLSYYIGTQIAETGYERNRPLEFTDPEHKQKAALLKGFDECMVMVQATLAKQSANDWGTAYTAKGEEDAGDRFTIFLRCAAHAYHHMGQIIYLSEEIKRQSAKAQRA